MVVITIVWDPQTGNWCLRCSPRAVSIVRERCLATLQPVRSSSDSPTTILRSADFDGDGKDDIAVFRNGTWYQRRSGGGVKVVAFGRTGDSCGVIRAAIATKSDATG